MPLIRLIHWNQSEALERADRLRALGYRVNAEPISEKNTLRDIAEGEPDAVVIDLSRLFSHGRTVGIVMRQTTYTRHILLVFVEGDPAKLPKLRSTLPDAVYSTWGRIKPDLKRALAARPAAPVVPPASLPAYPHSPLPKKLGIKAGMTVALLGAPRGFEKAVSPMPERVRRLREGRRADLAIWFVKSRTVFERGLARAASLAGVFWIAYPKQAAKVKSDLSQPRILAAARAAGLTHSKTCAIDATWTGLRFSRKCSVEVAG